MRRVLVFLVCLGVLAVPTVSVADHSTPSSLPSTVANDTETNMKSEKSGPASACKTQHKILHRRSRGTDANAFGKCVSMIAHERADSDGSDSAESGEDGAERQGNSSESQGKRQGNPAATCKRVQAHDPSAFQATYGDHPNAFGKCVSSHAPGRNG